MLICRLTCGANKLAHYMTKICSLNIGTKHTLNAQMSTSNKHSISSNTFDVEMNRIVWIDMEMTGLDIEIDKILEVACVITDSDLNVVAEGPDFIIQQPTDILNNMNEWCIKQHGKTGLTEASIKSNISVTQAEDSLMDFVSKYVTHKASPPAGNSVYTDRVFLRKCMPKLDEYLHYRIIDVSSIKELCRRWNPSIYRKAPEKNYSHRATSDILESIEELKFYKEHFFKI